MHPRKVPLFKLFKGDLERSRCIAAENKVPLFKLFKGDLGGSRCIAAENAVILEKDTLPENLSSSNWSESFKIIFDCVCRLVKLIIHFFINLVFPKINLSLLSQYKDSNDRESIFEVKVDFGKINYLIIGKRFNDKAD